MNGLIDMWAWWLKLLLPPARQQRFFEANDQPVLLRDGRVGVIGFSRPMGPEREYTIYPRGGGAPFMVPGSEIEGRTRD